MDIPGACADTCAMIYDRHPDVDGLHLAFRSRLVSIAGSSYHPGRLLPH